MTNSLLLDIAAGRAEAVDDAMRRFGGAVRSLARRLSPSEEDAEDAVQEVFVEIWRNAGRYEATLGSEMTFVMTIARRRLIDRLRRAGRSPRLQGLEEPEILVEERDEADPVEIGEEAARVTDAIEQLRPAQREVLRMALVDGRTHKQIADHVGIPLGTVKSHARRGLARVRAMLGVEDPE